MGFISCNNPTADTAVEAAGDRIVRAEPLSWWVGMRTPLQLRVQGKDISSCEVEMARGTRGVRVTATHKADNADFLFIDIDIAPDAAAGEYAVYYAVFAEQRVQYVHGHYLGVAVFFRQLFAVVYGLYAVLCKAVAVHNHASLWGNCRAVRGPHLGYRPLIVRKILVRLSYNAVCPPLNRLFYGRRALFYKIITSLCRVSYIV